MFYLPHRNQLGNEYLGRESMVETCASFLCDVVVTRLFGLGKLERFSLEQLQNASAVMPTGALKCLLFYNPLCTTTDCFLFNFVEREKNFINEENLDRLEKEIPFYAPFIRATPYQFLLN